MKQKRFSSLLSSAVVLLTLALLVFVPTAYAYDGRTGEQIIIGKDEVIADDLYLSGNEVIVDGTIQGDLIVVGRTITVNGTVEGDLWAAAQSVTVNGVVQDDVRIAGAVLTLGPESQVAGDTLAASYSLETRSGSTIGGSLLVAANKALLAGEVAQNLHAGTEGLEIQGQIGGNVEATVGAKDDNTSFDPMMFSPNMPTSPEVPNGLTLGESARIQGNLNYTSRQATSVDQGAVSGEVSHRIPEISREESQQLAQKTPFVSWALDNLRRLVALLIVGLLLIWLVPTWIQNPAARLQAQPLPSLGWGSVIALGFPFVILALGTVVIILAVLFGFLSLGNLVGTVIGIGGTTVLGLVVIFSLAATFLAKLVVGYLGGRYLLERITPAQAPKPVWALLFGTLMVVILLSIPFLGGLFNLVITLLGLGTLVLLWREHNHTTPVVVGDAIE